MCKLPALRGMTCVSSLQPCRHLQGSRPAFLSKRRPQPESDRPCLNLSQQVGLTTSRLPLAHDLSDLCLLNVCHRALAPSLSQTSPPVITLQNGLVSVVEAGSR